MNPSSIHRTVLPNGLTVLVQEDHSAPVVAIVTYVKAGYFDETDEQNGLAHALEHMFFKGTKKRGVGDIAKETKASGGYLNAAHHLRQHHLLHRAAVDWLRRKGWRSRPTRTRTP